MAIADYTSSDDIRAVLGVSLDELSDATLLLDIYWNLLLTDLESIDDDLPVTFTTISQLPLPTTAQQRFLRAAQMFATFSVAKQLTASLPLFAPRQKTDSKAGVERFADPYKETIKKVGEQYETARSQLVESLAAIGTTVTTAAAKVSLLVVSPSSDPITGT